MNRINVIKGLKDHAWYSKLVKKLSAMELIILTGFIIDNDALNKSDFELAVNRMFIDKVRPKNWLIIQELLCVANSGS